MAHHLTTHGLSQSRIYRIWWNMINRCDNPNVLCYQRYGGSGVSYKPEWRTFENFYNDMKTGYSDDLTLDRIDNNLGYNKDNCRWIPLREQNLNKRNNRLIEYKGEIKPLTAWIRILNLKPSTVKQRYYAYGWSIEKCLEYK